MRSNGGGLCWVQRMGCTESERRFWTCWHYDSAFSFSLVTVAVLRAAAMGSPRVGAMASSLAMVDSLKAMDSSKAIIPFRATGSRTSTTVAVEVEGVVEVRCFQLCLILAFCKELYPARPVP